MYEQKSKQNEILKESRGITLIALVVTIIVLIILAGVSVVTLTGDNGILSQADKAKIETRGASVEEECQLWKTNQAMDKQTTEGTAQTLQELLDSLIERNLITKEERETIEKTGKVTIGNREINFEEEDPTAVEAKVGEKVTGNKNKSYTKNGKTAIIPVGFTIVPGCDDIEEGLVISDDEEDTEEDGKKIANGNQFVWVPVEDFSNFERKNSYANGELKQYDFVSEAITKEKYYEPKGDGDTIDEKAEGTIREAQEMYKSVKYNKGFYIGRYEAGAEEGNWEDDKWSETTKVVCKKDVIVYNAIKWGNSAEDEKGGAVELSRGFTKVHGYKTVKSTLVYGVQWDAIMEWMKSVENQAVEGKIYIQDSTKMGWYGGTSPQKTGIDIDGGENNKSNKVKNIYDMAGNVWEWTMEAYDESYRVCRGGNFTSNASVSPVSFRNHREYNVFLR